MVRILVDSSSDYLPEQLQLQNIQLVPIQITIGETSYLDGIDLDRDHFYRILEETGEFPKTSQPSPQDFLDIFKDVKEKGEDLVCILLSSALSGTYQSATLAKTMVEYDRIYLVDSLSATCNIMVMADYACKLREQGMDGAGIAAQMEAFKSRVHVVAALDTLEYLSRGGRLHKTAAAIGDMAGIKPIITLTKEGTVGILGKCLGKNKAICAIKKKLLEYRIDDRFPVYTLYSYGTDNCTLLEEKLKQEGIRTDKRLQIGPTIGSHIGPEAFGILFVTQNP